MISVGALTPILVCFHKLEITPPSNSNHSCDGTAGYDNPDKFADADDSEANFVLDAKNLYWITGNDTLSLAGYALHAKAR